MYSSDSAQKELLDAAMRMAVIAEYREGNNTNHLERVRGYATALARGLGLNNREIQIIASACQLHDIGKVGIPEALLLKTGDFTAKEWDIIKRHTIVGADLLKGSVSPYLQAGESVALTHHERWDGSGYPNGLKGEDIPLGGRICAVADVFDALTTPRLYKKEISVDDARRLIVDAGGSLFDPKVVEVFDDVFDEILKIRKNRS
jgi:putative two-component system response regulator